MRIRTALQDAHIYLLKHWVLDLLASDTSISSIRSELIPFLVKKQHRTKVGVDHGWAVGAATPSFLPVESRSTRSDLDHIATEDPLKLLARDMSVWSDHTGDMADSYFGNSVRCYAYVVEKELCLRVNSISTYCEANRQVCLK